MNEKRPEDTKAQEASRCDDTFADMVSLGPPPVPDGFDDSHWHVDIAKSKSDPELSQLLSPTAARYQRRQELGHGGMATIYDTVDMTLRRHVAVKVIHPRQASKDASDDERSPLQRFIDEAQITAQLEHPNIVPVHEIGIDDTGNAYFTMKRVEGRSLRDVFDDMRAGKESVLTQYSEHTCLDVLLKVCDACAFAHSRNVVHRDLKPDNIMVGRFGEVQVMDWGLAKLLGKTDAKLDAKPADETFTGKVSVHSNDSQRTIEGTISGTPAYMSPEQARGEVSRVDQRSDVFLIGALLYEMLTLVPPFHSDSSLAALRRAQQHDLISVEDMATRLQANPELEDDTLLHPLAVERASNARRELAAIAEHALARRPQDRYQSVEAMIADIERYRRGQPVSVLRDSPIRAFGKWFSRHRLVTFAASAALVTALVAMVVVLYLERANDREEQKKDLDLRLAMDREEQLIYEGKQLESQRNLAEERKRSAEQAERLDKLLKRRSARGYLDQANDKLARAADASDENLRRHLRNSAVNLLNLAIRDDSEFGLPYIVRGQTHLQLGYLQHALDDLLMGTYLEREVELLGDDPAVLMTIAMIALAEGEMLSHRNWLSVYESALSRIKQRSESDASYYQLAQHLLAANQAARSLEVTDNWREKNALIEEISALTEQVAEIQERGTGLWEVHLFAGALRMYEALRLGEGPKAKQLLQQSITDFRHALTLRRQLPIVVRFLTRADHALRELESNETTLLSNSAFWDAYIKDFPDDPLGYFARARLPIEDLLAKRSDLWAATASFAAAKEDLRKAISLYPEFSEAIGTRGLIGQLEGALSTAHRDYAEAFKGWRPLLDNVPSTPASHPSAMSLLERYVRISVRLDSVSMSSERSLEALAKTYRRCAEEGEEASSWSDLAHSASLYRFAVSIAFDEAAKRGNGALIHQISNQALPKEADDADQLLAARAFMSVGDFVAAREHLNVVYRSNSERINLESRLDRITRAIGNSYVELRGEELLFANRIRESQQNGGKPTDYEITDGVTGATRLANAAELELVIGWLVGDFANMNDVTQRRDMAETIVRLFSALQIEDPARARAVGSLSAVGTAIREGTMLNQG